MIKETKTRNRPRLVAIGVDVKVVVPEAKLTARGRRVVAVGRKNAQRQRKAVPLAVDDTDGRGALLCVLGRRKKILGPLLPRRPGVERVGDYHGKAKPAGIARAAKCRRGHSRESVGRPELNTRRLRRHTDARVSF